MIGPWPGILLVLTVLVLLMGGLRVYQRLAAPHPEVVRKLLHVGMGLVTLSFPWLFDQAWPVVTLAALSIITLLSLRLVKGLRSGLGNVVSGVSRTSLGEVYFPVAVTIVFLLSLQETGDPTRPAVLYCIPVLLLTLADASAALVGIAYGRLHYPTSEGEKSAEGSFAFFFCAFFSAHVPLLLWTDTGRAETLLIALLLAWLAMMFEAISWRGLDNLVLPLVGFLLLKLYLDLPVADLLLRVGLTAALTIFLLLFRRQTTLVGDGVLGAFLVGYIACALGGWPWLLPPLVLFLTYTLLSPRTAENSQRVHNIHAVICVCSAGLLWLFLATILHRPEFLLPYTLSFAAHLAIIGVVRLGHDYPKMSGKALLTVCILKGWLILLVPCLVLTTLADQGTADPLALCGNLLQCGLIGLLGVTLAATAFYWTQPSVRNCPVDTPRWLRQAAHAGMGSMLALLSVPVL
jgi:phytol kinase